MGLAFFLWTITLLFVCAMGCMASVATYLLTARRDCVVSGICFLLYALDLSLILFDEYAGNKQLFENQFDEPVLHPIASALLGAALVSCIWIWALLRDRKPPTARRAALIVCGMSVVLLLLVPRTSASGIIQQYAYWLVRDMGVLTALVWLGWRWHVTDSEAERNDLARSARFWKLALLLTACMILEDTVMILVMRPDLTNPVTERFFWYLSERNVSENVLMVGCFAQMIRRDREVLRVYAQHPTAPQALAQTEEGSDDHANQADPIEDRIMIFADAYGLSPRERDVLRLMVAERDLQNIASELFISVGTVKAHAHRIYAKTKTSGRKELVAAFWRY